MLYVLTYTWNLKKQANKCNKPEIREQTSVSNEEGVKGWAR